LDAWQRAMDLVDEIYRATQSFPTSEVYGLSAQMRKAASSIPSDIAEGRGRHTKPDYRHFLYEARGGTQELETQIEIAMRQKFLKPEHAQRLIALVHRVGQLINGLLRSLEDR
jgi:four helix bundle protein